MNPLNGEPVHCTVDSVPSTNLKFHWMLSLSSNTSPTTTNMDLNQRELNQHTTVAHHLQNISSIFLLQDAFLTHRNGQLLCWAENEVGAQKVPCVFNLIKAGEYFVKIVHNFIINNYYCLLWSLIRNDV